MEPYSIFEDVAGRLEAQGSTEATRKTHPGYWIKDLKSLLCTANVEDITFGTGHQIYTRKILPAIEAAETEVVLVTCFLARSVTLDDLGDSLRKLSVKAQRNGKLIKVRICFSSSSIWQKLLQTSSLAGQIWPEAKWGLPRKDELQGLDMEVKSIFQLPFSVMHPKFVVVDRQRVLLPSCNVSWEDWFEGCVDLNGVVVEQFVRFWQSFWAGEEDRQVKIANSTTLSDQDTSASPAIVREAYAVFLPSPHHRFSLPWVSSEQPPATPLNIYLLTVFARAERDIYMQTPNLTSTVVLSAILQALERGVDVVILTSRRLMRLEQIITAGTTTERSVRSLIKRYQALKQHQTSPRDLEAGFVRSNPGRLIVRYHKMRDATDQLEVEPAQSHLKLTIVDGKVAVFGSGNMDRASWHTSQELGLALTSEVLVKHVRQKLSVAMEGRSVTEYDSNED
ncbi:hypothetical protein LTR22_021313 [Elasticomyces elasticus]|nr:hypothetical protein LTR22_021313 [Elasticomyces elasticus]KAK4909265.1 hypothetical protein LTR49_021935 [Elasticomyces elasticus]KAK5753543.1 hypothetical protein LTS12_016383 [Elasticomyces elasticus]